ncbi:MAG: ABC-type multidrug transport system fused ATPase/permease subunit, partial [Ilumatobacter sp.]
MVSKFLKQVTANVYRTLTVLVRSWLALAALLLGATAFIVVAVSAYAQLIGPRVSDQLNGKAETASDLVVFLTVIGMPLFLFLFAVGVVWAGAAAHVADGAVGHRSTSLVRATGSSVRTLPAAVGTGLSWGLIVVAAFVLAPLISIVGLLGLIATPFARRNEGSQRWPSVRTLVIAAIPFAVAALLALRLSLALPAVWLDGLRPRAALERSWQRVKGSTGVVGVVLTFASIATFAVVTLMVKAGQRFGLEQGGIALAQLAAQLLVAPLLVIATVVLYRRGQTARLGNEIKDLAPLPGSRKRQVAVGSAVAMALQALVLMPSTGLTFAAPVETVPVETVPVETVPVETVPVETVPVETVPVETVPVETVPVETVPV